MRMSIVWAGYVELSCLRLSKGSICLEASNWPGGIAQVKCKTQRLANKIGSIIGQAVKSSKNRIEIRITSMYKIKKVYRLIYLIYKKKWERKKKERDRKGHEGKEIE